MPTQPKIQLPLRPADKFLDILAWLLLAILTIIIFYYYPKLPSIIPTHFNASGKIDGYGSKTTLFLLPLIPTVLTTALTFLNKYPHVFNYPTKVTTLNAEHLYVTATRMIRILKLSIVFLFSFIAYHTIYTATSHTQISFTLLLPIILIVLLSPTIYFILKMLRKPR